MFDYKIYCYLDGELAYVVSSLKSWPTKAEALDAARTQAKISVMFAGEYEETEDGARIWLHSETKRIHKIYKVC